MEYKRRNLYNINNNNNDDDVNILILLNIWTNIHSIDLIVLTLGWEYIWTE